MGGRVCQRERERERERETETERWSERDGERGRDERGGETKGGL